MQEISAASKEQNSGADQVNSAVQQLNQVTQQNAASSEELATSAEELASQADQLNHTISYFNVDHSGRETQKGELFQESEQRTGKTYSEKPKSSNEWTSGKGNGKGNGELKELNKDNITYESF